MYKVYIFCLYVDNVYMYGCILFNFNVDCEFRVNFNLKEKKIIFLFIGNLKYILYIFIKVSEN